MNPSYFFLSGINLRNGGMVKLAQLLELDSIGFYFMEVASLLFGIKLKSKLRR